MDVELFSSSKLIGEKSVDLTIKIDPWARIKFKGTLIFEMPDYYPGATNDFMFGTD